jgi:tRNA (cytidine/uridine-2'-O-)-methyltransferase
MQLALFQPDIPQNLGTIIRFCACMGVTLHIIEPCGFPLDEKKLKRAAMDYYEQVDLRRHVDWEHFLEATKGSRIVLATTKASEPYTEVTYLPDDILLMGRESAGVPDIVHEVSDLRVLIPMRPECRSLNIAVSAAMIAGEMLRQVH